MKLKNDKIKRKKMYFKKSRLTIIAYFLVGVTAAIYSMILLGATDIPTEHERELPTSCPEDSPSYNFPLMVTDLDGQPLSGISIMPMPERGCLRTLSYLETDENGEATITSYSDESFSFLVQNATCSPQHHTLELRSENEQVCIVNGDQCTQEVMIQIECE